MPARPFVLHLFFLLFGTLVGDGDVPSIIGVDACHLHAEEWTVSGTVVEMVHVNIIMYHLMDKNVIEFVLGKVSSEAEAYAEIILLLCDIMFLSFCYLVKNMVKLLMEH